MTLKGRRFSSSSEVIENATVSSTVTKLRQNTYGLRTINDKHCWEMSVRVRFWPIVGNRGNHLAHGFIICNFT
ncbi:hypothetical protein LAZ67_2006294 [Cordylochernes scorpioides]|uniref:Uncharacterized protein n=1 Tax=Cordylochernes scorpioides TaxID=51811 RepID=A0ABY6K556_9ARAC|nr:hypothetical protein LAZ67_2006294 [Cordylochernes scorpioides]